ncbi:hypothetical protein BFX86_09465 [Enterobacter hormaechei]|uniref:hypothetical protein n=1 Tax=Enterobacter hormaechei TaxID=158836 RepID=UPI0005EF9194|nr:hypothetical protein [Enterobacter hormaechei]ELX7457076.1 hypothetical protein [Enterobacter hormaechei subsp. hoffmannii]MBH4409827.1 hypothetical protein [Pseudomonas aeruginosa]EHN8717687.1 hypothetical protein [Enterobacter hormaechei]EJV4649394.1 hypothetical protein [Enterobacter hormaechei]EKK5495978.1 hypothetical protein [Enterobacter hormaechei]
MKKLILAVMACSILSGCKIDLNQVTPKIVDPINNYKCYQTTPVPTGDVKAMFISLNTATGDFLDDGGTKAKMKKELGIWSGKQDDTEVNFVEQGNVANINYTFHIGTVAMFIYSCHKEKAIN